MHQLGLQRTRREIGGILTSTLSTLFHLGFVIVDADAAGFSYFHAADVASIDAAGSSYFQPTGSSYFQTTLAMGALFIENFSIRNTLD